MQEYAPFGFFFQIMPLLFSVVFIAIVIMILVTAIRGLIQWNKNNRSPVLTVDAKIVAKRTNVQNTAHTDNNMAGSTHTTSSTTYYATFEVESGDRMELRVSPAEYGMLAEGDCGRLTFQGTRYHSFERNF